MQNKPGYKTTEFWLSSIVTIAGIIVTITNPHSTPSIIAGTVLSILSALGYTAARTSVKNNMVQS